MKRSTAVSLIAIGTLATGAYALRERRDCTPYLQRASEPGVGKDALAQPPAACRTSSGGGSGRSSYFWFGSNSSGSNTTTTNTTTARAPLVGTGGNSATTTTTSRGGFGATGAAHSAGS
jgi:hypothetical protein